MIVLYRTPDFNDLTYHYNGSSPNQVVDVYIADNDGKLNYLVACTTNDYGVLDIDLTDFGGYDRVLNLVITDQNNNYLKQEWIELVRPYLPYDSAIPFDQFKDQERRIRAVIDSVTGGFYLRRKVITYDALGGDVLPIEGDVIKIIRAWQNGVLVYGSGSSSSIDFIIGKDRTTITIDGVGNRLYGNSVGQKLMPSDYYMSNWYDFQGEYYNTGLFSAGTDFDFDIEYGYLFIPSDIQLAAQILSKDGSCVDTYINHYIVEYDTDQYRIKYASGVFNGTGNLEADRILARYANLGSSSIRAGVL